MFRDVWNDVHYLANQKMSSIMLWQLLNAFSYGVCRRFSWQRYRLKACIKFQFYTYQAALIGKSAVKGLII